MHEKFLFLTQGIMKTCSTNKRTVIVPKRHVELGVVHVIPVGHLQATVPHDEIVLARLSVAQITANIGVYKLQVCGLMLEAGI